jgi:hypothetical protein
MGFSEDSKDIKETKASSEETYPNNLTNFFHDTLNQNWHKK